MGYIGKETGSMTWAYVSVKLLHIFIEHLLYAQYQGDLGTQLLSSIPTGFSESLLIISHAFHSPDCPPVIKKQHWVTVDSGMEQAWATDEPKQMQ